MSKSKEELDALKEEVETVNRKLQELTPEEIARVNGGCDVPHAAPVVVPAVGEPPVPQTAPVFDY